MHQTCRVFLNFRQKLTQYYLNFKKRVKISPLFVYNVVNQQHCLTPFLLIIPQHCSEEKGDRSKPVKIPFFSIIFLTDCLKFQSNKKKTEVRYIRLQITKISFYESDYVTLHSDISIMTENGTEMTHKLPRY